MCDRKIKRIKPPRGDPYKAQREIRSRESRAESRESRSREFQLFETLGPSLLEDKKMMPKNPACSKIVRCIVPCFEPSCQIGSERPFFNVSTKKVLGLLEWHGSKAGIRVFLMVRKIARVDIITARYDRFEYITTASHEGPGWRARI